MLPSGARRALFPAILLIVPAAVLGVPSSAQAAASCAAFSARIYDRVNPRSSTQLLTRSSSESSASRAYGFTHDRGASFKVASGGGTSLAAVHRLRHTSTGDLFYSLNADEIDRAISAYGYRNEGVAFYATTTRTTCLMPVVDFYMAGIHRFITRSAEAASLEANGWSRGRTRFYVAPPTPDPKFTFAVIPDTQEEVYNDTDPRFRNRTGWLTTNKTPLDLRFVAHTGDVVNWDTSDHAQYRRAQSALQLLKNSQIPFSVSPGNHDTGAVCPGGSACPGADTHATVRNTRSFNTYLSMGVDNLGGRFEAGKVDNTYSTFTAGGLQWLVLNLELWPRPAAITWAKRVVSTHPRHNVAIVTHGYLSSAGNIGTLRLYGDSSPKELFDQLIKVYPNVRLVFSGHAGTSLYRTDRGANGNTIYTMQMAIHSRTTNPVRLLEIHTAAGTMSSRVYAPFNRQSFPTYGKTYTGVQWVR